MGSRVYGSPRYETSFHKWSSQRGLGASFETYLSAAIRPPVAPENQPPLGVLSRRVERAGSNGLLIHQRVLAHARKWMQVPGRIRVKPAECTLVRGAESCLAYPRFF